MAKIIISLFIAISMGTLYHIPTSSFNKGATLISRKILFDNPDHTQVRLSPNGKWISYLAPKDGILNVWIQDVVTGEAKAITDIKKRGIYTYEWAFDNTHILYTRDTDGDENWQLYKVAVKTEISTLLTPEKGVHTKIIKASHLHPTKILIGLNNRDPRYHDIYLLNIETGEKNLVLHNTEFACEDVIADNNLNIILAKKMNSKAEWLYYRFHQNNQKTLYRTVKLEDVLTTVPLEVDHLNKSIYWLDSEDNDKTSLVKINLETKQKELIAKGKQADLNLVIFHPTTKKVLAVGENYLKQSLEPMTPDMEEDFKILRNIDQGEINIVSTNLEYNKWIIAYMSDQQPVKFYLYDRNTKQGKFLFYNKKDLIGLPLVEMVPVEIKTRDDLTLVSYLSRPYKAKSKALLPMVLCVHGGPIARDKWGLNPIHQWLANRGYAVLSVNYRGSAGFGKSFIKASYGEWGRKMHDDLIDAVNWAIKEKIADPKKIAIFGGSYGGYASLVGATITPEIFACAIDIVGPSSLTTLLETIPPYWKCEYELLKIWVGADPATEKGKAFLKSRSPLNYIDNIKKPLLIAQGANDPRVKKWESEQIVNAMIKKKIPVTYLLFPDEGHGFGRPENSRAYMAAMEVFLHQNLGGFIEPIGNEFKKSSMQVVVGKI